MPTDVPTQMSTPMHVSMSVRTYTHMSAHRSINMVRTIFGLELLHVLTFHLSQRDARAVAGVQEYGVQYAGRGLYAGHAMIYMWADCSHGGRCRAPRSEEPAASLLWSSESRQCSRLGRSEAGQA